MAETDTKQTGWRSLPIIRRYTDPAPKVAVLRLSGAISGGGFGRGLSLSTMAPMIKAAFGLRGLKAVALQINSPGGSPVQSALIHRRIRALAAEKKVPVYAFCEDVAASGGYWLALAADKIYADENSIIGSVGVISGGFGFPDALVKLGVERRKYTAGGRKGMLDPFQPEQENEVAHLQSLLKDMHDSFRNLVTERRGDALAPPEDEDLLDGAFWTGKTALRLGLIDALGDLRETMRTEFGEKVRFRVMRRKRGLAERLGLGRSQVGPGDLSVIAHGAALGLASALEERALWARYGL